MQDGIVPDWVKDAPKKNNNSGIPDWVKNAPSKTNNTTNQNESLTPQLTAALKSVYPNERQMIEGGIESAALKAIAPQVGSLDNREALDKQLQKQLMPTVTSTAQNLHDLPEFDAFRKKYGFDNTFGLDKLPQFYDKAKSLNDSEGIGDYDNLVDSIKNKIGNKVLYQGMNIPQRSVTEPKPEEQNLKNIADTMEGMVKGEGGTSLINPITGIIGAIDRTIKLGTEANDAFTKGNVLQGFAQSIKAASEIPFTVAMQLTPGGQIINEASGLATAVLPENISKWQAPVTAATNPQTSTGKALASLADMGVQFGVAHLVGKFSPFGKNQIISELDKNSIESTNPKEIIDSQIKVIENSMPELPAEDKVKAQAEVKSLKEVKSNLDDYMQRIVRQSGVDADYKGMNTNKENVTGITIDVVVDPDNPNPALRKTSITLKPEEFSPDNIRKVVEEKQQQFKETQNASTTQEIQPETGQGGTNVLEQDKTISETNIEQKTSLKNRYTDAEREQLGLPPLETNLRPGTQELYQNSEMNYKPVETRTLAQEIVDNPQKEITRQQQSDLLYDKVNLRREGQKLTENYKNALESGNQELIDKAQTDLLKNKNDLDINTKATKSVGTTASDFFTDRKKIADIETGTLENEMAKAKANNNNKELSGSQSKNITDRFNKIQEENNKLQDMLEKERTKSSDLEKQLSTKRMARDAAYQSRKLGRAQSKAELQTEFQDLNTKLYKILSGSAHAGIPIEGIPIVKDMAFNLFKQGITTAEEIADNLYQTLKDKFDISKEDILGAVSGYGKVTKQTQSELIKQWNDVKSQMREIRKLQDLENKQHPLKQPKNLAKPSPELEELRAKVKTAMDREGFTKELSDKAYRTRLQNQIEDLTNRIQTKEKIPPKNRNVTYDSETQDLINQRNKLKDEYSRVVEGKEELTPEEKRNKTYLESLNKRIKEVEGKISSKNVSPPERATENYTDEIKQQKLYLENLNKHVRDIRKLQELEKQYKDLQEGKRPEKRIVNKEIPNEDISALRQKIKSEMKKQGFTEEDSNANYLKRLQAKEQEIRTKLANKDFEKPQRVQREYPDDIKAQKLKVDKAKRDLELEQRKIEYANRGKFEKVLGAVTRYSRFNKLTGIGTAIKLTAFSGSKMIARPILDAIGGAIGKIPGISKIVKQAPTEGRFSPSAEIEAWKAFGKAITSKNFKDVMKEGETDFSATYQGENVHLNIDPSFLDYAQKLHQILKEPLKEATFAKSYKMYREWQSKQPDFERDNFTQRREAETYAYEQGIRSILMHDNKVSHFFNSTVRQLENIKGRGEKAGKLAAAITRFFIPITRVPVNFAMEGTEYAYGTLKGAASAIYHTLNGTINKLTPEQADYIMRNLKKGSVAPLLFIAGYVNRDNIGGYYQQGIKKQPDEVGYGSVKVLGITPKIFGVDFTRYLIDNPLFEPMFMGATFGHVLDHENERGEDGLGAYATAGFAAAKSPFQDIPYLDITNEINRALESGTAFSKLVGQLISGAVVPPDVSKIARMTDLDEEGNVIKREQGIIKTPASNIPGLRQQVPEYIPGNR